MLVDFHVHSTASDGTMTPVELAETARSRSFDAIALTDHDNTDGLGGWPYTTGTELSIEPGDGFDRFHLLALGIDPANEGLRRFLKRILEGRNERNERIIANFAKIGIGIDPDDIARYAHGEVLARPHFANWLVEHGFATDRMDAFARYLLPESPAETRCYEERYHPSQAEAFDIVHKAGGLCVMAHPKYWRRGWKDAGCEYADAERELIRLKESGLDGLEAMYQANTVEENIAFTRMADRIGLLKTAGSDFHGENKPTIRLGMEVAESFIRPFLDRIGIQPAE